MFDKFEAVEKDYGKRIALLAIQLYTINMTMKIYKVTRERILKKFNKLAWDVDDSDKELAIKVYDVLYDYEVRQSLDGIGGCEIKTIKELVEMESVKC